MNLKLVMKLVGRVIMVETVVMVIPMLMALFCAEDVFPFAKTIVLMGLIGAALAYMPTEDQFFSWEGFFSVGLIWVVTGLFGALPYYFSGYFPSFVDCLFESYSGFTTTGATILTDIEALPKSILFWRAFTQWLGGMGVLVLVTALLPSMGIRTHYLTKAEITGPVFSKLVPKQSQSSKILYGIYCTLTLTQVICLKLAGMPLYDSFIHALTSAGTGGFSNRNASVGAYGSPVIELIITVFIILFSVNYAMIFLLLRRRFREVLRSDELKFFLVAVGVSTAAIALNIRDLYDSIHECVRHALFEVVCVISSTGFAVTDYCLWPQFSQIILMLLMFCGACAGSTSGGMKSSRILLAFRAIRRELRRIAHPSVVEVVKLDGKVVKEDDLKSVKSFIVCYLFLILAGTLVVSLDNFGLTETFTAALSCMSNVGPGLGWIGPTGTFLPFSPLSKVTLSVLMIVGRLEIFPVLVLFSRNTWNKV